jgi:CRP-like cAMP-binding protein
VDVVKDDQVVADLGAGDHFGEVALLEHVPRTASIVARTPVRAFRLDREGFETVVERAFRAGSIRRASDRSWEH